MKIKALFLLLLAFVISIDCNAGKKPEDKILESTMHNNIEYKIIITWWKNDHGSYNPSIIVTANNKQIFYEKHPGPADDTKFIKIDGYLFIRNRHHSAHYIYDDQGRKIQSTYSIPDYAGIKNFEDIERPLICFSHNIGSVYEEFFTLDGKLLIPEHDKVKTYSSGLRKLYHISNYKTEGLMDENFNFIFPVKKHQEIDKVEDSPFFICKNEGSNTRIYNSLKDKFLPYISFDRIKDTNLYIVGAHNSFGIYNSEQDRETLPMQYEQIEPTAVKDYVKVKKDGMCGIMSVYGKEIIPPKYRFINLGDTHLAIVMNNGSGLFDMLTHTEIFPPSFEVLEIIDTNLVKYRLNGFWGVMDLNGKEIIPTTRGYTAIDYIKGLKKFTYSMHGFKGECNSLGAQLSKIAVPVNDSSINNNSSETLRASTTNENSDKKSSNNNQLKAYTETVPIQVWQPCGGCNGSGQCGVCFGSGWILNFKGYKSSCTACHGSGKCTSCAGHGGQNVVRYETRTVYR